MTSPTLDLSPTDPAIDTGPKVDEKKLLAWCMEQHRRCKNDRLSVERQWYINLAFYFGRQNVRVINSAVSATGFALNTPPAPPWRVRMVVNKVRPVVRTTLAKVVSQKPKFVIVPATSEDNDQAAARVAEQILDAEYSAKNIKRILRRAEWWTIITGTGFIKDYWDGSAVDYDSQQIGDIVVEPVTPFHVFVPDLLEEELENQPYLIHQSMKSLDWVERAYGKKVNAPTTKSTNDILEDSFLSMVGAKTASNKDEVLMLEFWIKPGHKMLPGGGLVTIVGETIVQVITNYPYAHGQFPFSKLDAIPSGKFYADSVITDMIPIQREYNRTRSQIIEAKNLMSKPKLIAPKGSINPNQITSEPGQVILYTPGFDKPTPMPLPSLPSHVMQEIQQLQQDMDDVSGQHEISRGQNPSQVTAATALSYLQEQDDTKLSDTISSLEEGVEKLGRHILSHVSQFWTTERTVQIVGADGSFDAQVYKGSAIGGNLAVRVEAGSALPQSKAAKQAFVMDLIKMQIIEPQKALEMLELGGIERVYEDYLVDVKHAQRENIKMSDGQPVEPNDFDNHEIHIDQHNKFRKSQEYEALPDQIKQMFQEHIDVHYMATGQKSGVGMPLMPPGMAGMEDPNAMPGQEGMDPAQSQAGPPAGPPPM